MKYRGIARLLGRSAMLGCLLLVVACGNHDPLPDFASIDDIPTMKRAFYAFLAPIVVAQNHRISEQRQLLLGYQTAVASGTLGWWESYQLHQLAKEYEVDDDAVPEHELIEALLARVDIIPVDLALAQAAKESGWGRSRFAIEVNNLFGQWCYTAGCGVVPSRRAAGANHEIEAFDSVAESIRRYMNNLNTHERYAQLRKLRARQRAQGLPVTGQALAPGLLGYSERGSVYIEEILAMIHRNQSLLDAQLQHR